VKFKKNLSVIAKLIPKEKGGACVQKISEWRWGGYL